MSLGSSASMGECISFCLKPFYCPTAPRGQLKRHGGAYQGLCRYLRHQPTRTVLAMASVKRGESSRGESRNHQTRRRWRAWQCHAQADIAGVQEPSLAWSNPVRSPGCPVMPLCRYTVEPMGAPAVQICQSKGVNHLQSPLGGAEQIPIIRITQHEVIQSHELK